MDRREELIYVLDFMLAEAKRREVDLILIAGDVLHRRRNPDVKDLELVLDYFIKFSQIAPVVVVIGNHDWEGLKTYKKFLHKDIYIAENFLPFVVETDSGSVTIFPVPYLKASRALVKGKEKVEEEIFKLFSNLKQKRTETDWRVMVGHLMVNDTKVVPPQVEEKLDNLVYTQWFPSNMDYIALGHVHRMCELLNNPPVFYSGSIIQNNFSEEEDKGFLVYDTSLNNWDFVKLPHKKLKTYDLTHIDSSTELIETVERLRISADYIRLKISTDLVHVIGKVKSIPNVMEIVVISRESEDEKTRIRLEDKGKDFESLFMEYLRSSLTGEIKDRASSVLKELYEELKRISER